MYEVEQKTINWLLENNNPPVKYLTQIKILDIDKQDKDVLSSKNQIMTYQPIKEILKNQIENRYWFDARKDRNYKKYLGTFWQLIFLYELNALSNVQIENAIEHIFSTGQAPNGGFSMTGTNSGVITCLTSNILRALIHFNYLDDERTKAALEHLMSDYVDKDGYIRCRMYGLASSCYMTIPKILYALSAIPSKERSPRVKKGINLCVKLLLENQIYKYVPEKNREWLKYANEKKLKGSQFFEERKKFLEKNLSMKKVAKAGWMKFGFPLNYNSDVLDVMRSLVSADVKYSSEMDSALELIKNKHRKGKWINEKQYKSPMYTQIEPYKGKSKWITLHALTVLKHFEGLKIIS